MKRILSIIYIMCCFSFSLAQKTENVTELRKWKAGTIVTETQIAKYSIDSCFAELPITESVKQRMYGKSYKQNCKIPFSDLCYLRLLHRNKEGKIQLGEMVCSKIIAKDLLEIFRELYNCNYRIERMVLVDDYDANDEISMTANNTSCFNYRAVSGAKTLSKHSRGLAVDVNPLFNPCVNLKTGLVEPNAGKRFIHNRRNTDGNINFISHNDLCYKLFISHGFTWGGDWKSKKDYQHFEKNM